MGDPVTMAVVGASAGAMMNKKDPLKGALLGAAGGYGGASMMGLGAAPNIASTTGLGMAGNAASATSATMPGAVGGFGKAVTTIVPEVAPAATDLTSLINQGLSADLALDAANYAGTTGGYTGLGMAGNPAANMTFLDKLGAGANAVGQYAQQNPVLTQMAMQTGQSLLQQREPQLQSPGLMRGNPSQVAAPQYQVGIPKVSLI